MVFQKSSIEIKEAIRENLENIISNKIFGKDSIYLTLEATSYLIEGMKIPNVKIIKDHFKIISDSYKLDLFVDYTDNFKDYLQRFLSSYIINE